jgi:hypothetical protein
MLLLMQLVVQSPPSPPSPASPEELDVVEEVVEEVVEDVVELDDFEPPFAPPPVPPVGLEPEPQASRVTGVARARRMAILVSG